MASQAERPTITRGAGQRLLKWCSIALFGIAWAWLLYVVLSEGQPLIASAFVAALVLVIARGRDGAPGLEAGGGAAAVAAGVLWMAGACVLPMVDAIDANWAIVASALFMLPALIVFRSREAQDSAWLGVVGFVIGFLPVLIGAVLTGGVLAPLSGQSGLLWIALGTPILLVGSILFAVVAFWVISLSRIGLLFVLVGAAVELIVGGMSFGLQGAQTALTALGGLSFGVGWMMLGIHSLQNPGGLRG